jgi:hypothetical protein
MNTNGRNPLLRYVHPARNELFPDILEDFREVARRAPEEAVAQGIAAAFRSEETGSRAKMVADLFLHSDARQRADLLNILVAFIGENARHALSNAGLFGLDADSRHVTAEWTLELSPEAIGVIAAEAEQQDSRVVDRISAFYAPYSAVVSKLGVPAVLTILTHIAGRASSDVNLWLSVQRGSVRSM